MLHCLKIIKPKRYKKLVIQVFAGVKYFYKYLQIVIILKQDFWNMIVIVISYDFLYKDFDTTIASLLKVGHKTIDLI